MSLTTGQKFGGGRSSPRYDVFGITILWGREDKDCYRPWRVGSSTLNSQLTPHILYSFRSAFLAVSASRNFLRIRIAAGVISTSSLSEMNSKAASRETINGGCR